jgi:hypothetical protein
LAGTSFTFFTVGLVYRPLRFWRELAPHYFRWIVLEAAQIWRELAPHYFLADCFGGSSDLVGTGSTLFSCGLFSGRSDLAGTGSTFFRQIVLEVAQIWRELASHYFPADCFGGSSDLAGTGSTLFSGGLFWRQLRFGRNWLHIMFSRIALVAAQIWWDLAPHYFLADCFGGGSDLAGTGSTLFSGGLF